MKLANAVLLAIVLTAFLGGSAWAQCAGCGGCGDAAADEQKARQALETSQAALGIALEVNPEGFLALAKVDKDGLAEKAGFKAGDVLVSSNGKEIADVPAFLNALKDSGKAGPVAVRLVREGKLVRLRAGRGCDGNCGEGCGCGGNCGEGCGCGCDGKGKCEGGCKGKDGCACGGKGDGKGESCGGCKGGEGCKCGGKCGEGCGCGCGGKGNCEGGCKGGCRGSGEASKAPPAALLADLLGIVPAAFDDGAAQVKEVAKEKAGARLGLAAGDVILQVNGIDVGKRIPIEAVLARSGKSAAEEIVVLREKQVMRLHPQPAEEKAEGAGCGGCGGSG
jgi:hypothetical protein